MNSPSEQSVLEDLQANATCEGDADLHELFIDEPADVYHAKAGKYLSSHLLADFRRCPLLYHRKRCGLVPNVDRKAYLLGRATHAVILEGLDAFHRAFAVGGPVNPTTGRPFGKTSKAWAEWAAEHGNNVLDDGEFDQIMRMAKGVNDHKLASELLSDGFPEGVVRGDYCGLPCQIRMDWFTPHRALCDLKTCNSIDYFESDSRRFGYCNQLAFYVAVLQQRIGLRMPAYFIAVEKHEPFRCGVWRVSDDVLDHATRENEAAIERLKGCLEGDEWLTGYEECRVFDYV
ncbi:MAG: PD-(D/E)XK nuclease-like domain-containing protein [Pirellulaceae bacterium]|nr:hypothetical protein [Planctomycetaceae bacterium]MDP6721734.1 PD-(D/E)XK nuclease-like domain-containing protein [Pirellulaceae bacterium]